jgi:hypothetical protein
VTISNATREGARFASIEPGNIAGIEQRVRNELSGMGITVTSIEATYPSGSNAPGEPVRVRVSYLYNTFLGAFVGYPQLSLSYAMEMVIL